MGLDDLPGLNAALNGTSAVVILLGRRFAKRHDVRAHRACMLVAVALSTLFLASYVTYHVAKEGLVTRFPAAGQVSVHVVTDLEVGREEIRDLLDWARSKTTVLRVYTWGSADIERVLAAEPELKRVVEFLPS